MFGPLAKLHVLHGYARYIIMEYANGGDLGIKIKAHRAIGWNSELPWWGSCVLNMVTPCFAYLDTLCWSLVCFLGGWSSWRLVHSSDHCLCEVHISSWYRFVLNKSDHGVTSSSNEVWWRLKSLELPGIHGSTWLSLSEGKLSEKLWTLHADVWRSHLFSDH